MALGAKTGGRKKGTPNKTTVRVKEALEQTFDRMGGVEAMLTWAQQNQTEFFKLYAKLLPIELNGNLKVTDGLGERLSRAAQRIKDPEAD